MAEKQPAVYMLTNKRNGTLYVGVTSNLSKRIDEHRQSRGSTFTTKYHLTILVFMELHQTMYDAIAREKQLKAGSRKKKLALIEKDNPRWEDLSSLV